MVGLDMTKPIGGVEGGMGAAVINVLPEDIGKPAYAGFLFHLFPHPCREVHGGSMTLFNLLDILDSNQGPRS